MAEKHPETEKEHAVKARSRLILAGLVVVLLAVIAVSLTTNLGRMWAKWEEADKGAHSGSGSAMKLNVKQERVEIVSGDRRHSFMVEVMRSEPERARGLMFRQHMPQDQGMLFDFERDQNVTMWMKNTYISLDMIFIRSDGRIHRIETRTEPESERTISSGAPVRAVLEVNSGVAARLGLKAGDRVQHEIFR
ncbi:MAG: DUF192 domain-containing protein [Proteobacteria bacterium]|nr:DUF192 domain-containing protein [Pseudomonadota bacterium]